MNIKGLNHIAIIAGDLKKTRIFYENILGFSENSCHSRPEKHDTILNVSKADIQLEIFIKKEAPKRPTFPEAKGLRHLAFSVDDVKQTAVFLQKQGVKVEKIRLDDFNGKKMTFCFDPDGLPIELHE
ncbi:VOC family protein [Oenococcus alcoholitolerans]|uniref:SMU1112c/YaeR family gloxylase I-like metalloprotein n=1 Tax=Oenococcus alcoholitolerans TaxID=931074 RepID=UPI003F7101EA